MINNKSKEITERFLSCWDKEGRIFGGLEIFKLRLKIIQKVAGSIEQGKSGGGLPSRGRLARLDGSQ